MDEKSFVSYIYSLFFNTELKTYAVKNIRNQDVDFREVFFCEDTDGNKSVIKLAENDFTSPERIAVWKRCAEEYRKLGYYCPKIYSAFDGTFPVLPYRNHTCTIFAEDFSRYPTADSFEESKLLINGGYSYLEDAIAMNARVAAAHFDFASFPSAWCAFEKFCPSDTDDEVAENAEEWREIAKKLPDTYQPQVDRIWNLWQENRSKLQKIYGLLPTSVFQADINHHNILLDEGGIFKGVLDFNICGRDTVVNYLFRESAHLNTVPWSDEQEEKMYAKRILKAISIFKKHYFFSSLETEAAPLLYRYHRPLWMFNWDLEQANGNCKIIEKCLCNAENLLTEEIDWKSAMLP